MLVGPGAQGLQHAGHGSSMEALSDFLSNFAEWLEEAHFSVFSSSISF